MPAFLRKKNYQDVTDGNDTVFQPAYNTTLDTYAWFAQNPLQMGALIKYMGMEQTVRGRWLDEYPIERETQGWDPELPVFVDVGGNVGHYCAMFKNRFPSVPGRVILQDLPDTLGHALQTPGVEALPHDFFQAQPIKGKYAPASLNASNLDMLMDPQAPSFTISVGFSITGTMRSRRQSCARSNQP